ncbi:MAG: hypothetical protein ABH952_02150 [Candidatus Omnitrophota bacterium]
MFYKCPGSQKFRQPEPEILLCPHCKAEVEIWTDEAKTTCPKCKKTIIREQGAGCLDWCKHAKDCVGINIYNKYIEKPNYMREVEVMDKDKFIKEVVEKVWPKTKAELEKVIDNTKKMLNKGEEYLKVVSEKSINKTHEISLNLRKEKLSYKLGKLLAGIPKNKWPKDEKVNTILKEFKEIEKEIKKLK